MEANIAHLDEIWTADDKRLGLAIRYVHRKSGVDPTLRLYATYLVVENYELGVTYYIPTEYIANLKPESGKVSLSVTMKEVMKQLCFRMPTFIARGEGQVEALPTR